MPELPEIETLRRSLKPHVIGRRFNGVQVYDPRLRVRVDEKQLRLLPGKEIIDVRRRGKYLILATEENAGLVIHLGMSGRLLYKNVPAAKGVHEHLRFVLDDGSELRFQDPRRFGLVELVLADAGGLTSYARFKNLGMEPLTTQCTPRTLLELSRGVKKPIKNFLMDASQIVGVGNIYASEALFVAGIHPRRAAGRLSLAAWIKLSQAIKRVLRRAIQQGGTTLNDFRDANGQSGYFQVRLRVYDRQGEPCRRCRGLIRREVLAGRSTYYCSRCQK